MRWFPSWRQRVSLGWPFFLGFALLLFSTFAFFVGGPGRGVAQPIAFNHARHIQNGMTCTDCHSGAQNQAHAALPPLSTCLVCHETALTKSAEEEKVRALAVAGKEFQWTQLTRLSPHVYFSHRRHVGVAKLDCSLCHGPVEKASFPPRRALRAMTMDTCIECHQKSGARTDCNDCHR